MCDVLPGLLEKGGLGSFQGNHSGKQISVAGFQLLDAFHCFLQCSRQQGHQLGLVDALVDGVAVSIHCILFAVNCFRYNGLHFMSNKAIDSSIGIRNKVKTTWI